MPQPVSMMAFERMKQRKSGLGGLLSQAIGFIPGQLIGNKLDQSNPNGFGGGVRAIGGALDVNRKVAQTAAPFAPIGAQLGGGMLRSFTNSAPTAPLSETASSLEAMSQYGQQPSLQQPNFGDALKRYRNKPSFLNY